MQQLHLRLLLKAQRTWCAGFAGISGTGEATTLALTATGTKLTVTADMLGPGGSLTVSIGSELVSAPVLYNDGLRRFVGFERGQAADAEAAAARGDALHRGVRRVNLAE